MGENFKPPFESPEEMHKRMGTQRLLEELAEKYGLDKKETQGDISDNANRANSYKDESWLERLTRKKREQERAIEGAEKRHEVYSPVEIARLRGIRDNMDELIADFEKRNASLKVGTREYVEAARKTISKIIVYLDTLDVWSQKFTTMVGSGMDDPLIPSEEDSLYYLTDSGISMRIKRAALADGESLATAVQPFMELILFRDPNVQEESYSKTPVLGWTTKDYETSDFSSRFKDERSQNDYRSPLVQFRKGERVLAVGGPDDVWIHSGNRVNSITSF